LLLRRRTAAVNEQKTTKEISDFTEHKKLST